MNTAAVAARARALPCHVVPCSLLFCALLLSQGAPLLLALPPFPPFTTLQAVFHQAYIPRRLEEVVHYERDHDRMKKVGQGTREGGDGGHGGGGGG